MILGHVQRTSNSREYSTSEGVSQDGTGCESYNPDAGSSIPEGDWLGYPGGDPVLFENTRVCVDDVPYWLLSGAASIKQIGAGRLAYSNYMLALDAPYGSDALDGTQW